MTALVKIEELVKRKISIDELHRRLRSKSAWSSGDIVLDGIKIAAVAGGTILILTGTGHSAELIRPGNSNVSNSAENIFPLYESGSSASVVLAVNSKSEVLVR
jgi:hypothetical protein